jgi:hypothetical protein
MHSQEWNRQVQRFMHSSRGYSTLIYSRKKYMSQVLVCNICEKKRLNLLLLLKDDVQGKLLMYPWHLTADSQSQTTVAIVTIPSSIILTDNFSGAWGGGLRSGGFGDLGGMGVFEKEIREWGNQFFYRGKDGGGGIVLIF